MADFVLADLHLPLKDSCFHDGFERFCAHAIQHAQQVFILGDLFEYWIGDDVGLSENARAIRALRQLTEKVPVHLQHGNRDFLLGSAFAKATGVRILADQVLMDLGGTPTLLAHGDQFCTQDIGYQRWRSFSRRSVSQWLYLRLSVARRRKIAGGLRNDDRKRDKPEMIMDVNPSAIVAALCASAAPQLVHGHTHRPMVHRVDCNGAVKMRIVLPDWRAERMAWLEFANHSYQERDITSLNP